MKRFKENVETFIMECVIHMLCSPDIVDKTSNYPTPEEVLTKEVKFKYIHIFKRYGGNRYDKRL